MGVRVALLTLALVACSRTRDPNIGRPCALVRDGAAQDGGAGAATCPTPLTCNVGSGVCHAACTTDADCAAYQGGGHPGSRCDHSSGFELGCVWTCANDGECPFGLSCLSSHLCD
jgi:hypothetical protein